MSFIYLKNEIAREGIKHACSDYHNMKDRILGGRAELTLIPLFVAFMHPLIPSRCIP